MVGRLAGWKLPIVVALLSVACTCRAQVSPQQTPDYSANPRWFPKIADFYRPRAIPPLDLSNTKSLSDMVRDGKIELSLSQFATGVVENNLTLAGDRYNTYFAQTDFLRSKGGQAARGVIGNAGIPTQLFSSAIGAGVGNLAALGGIGITGNISGVPRSPIIPPGGAFDPTLIFNVSWDHTGSPLNTVIVAGTPSVVNTTAFYQAGWQQAFTSGTSFRVAFTNERQGSTQQFLIYNPDVISRMTLAFTQQLLNGFGFPVNRRFIDVTRNNLEIVHQWFLQQTDTTLAQAEGSYWDLVAAQEQVKAAQQALQVAQQLLQNTQRQVEAGLATDVVSEQSQVAASQRDLVIAQTNLQQQELTLKTFFSKDIDSPLGDAQIVATDPLPEPQPADIPPVDEAIAEAVRNRPEVPQAEGLVKNEKLTVKVTGNFLKPTLDIFGYFASAGLSGSQFLNTGAASLLVRNGLPQALTQLIDGRYPEYSAGFILSIPIRNRAALADRARAGLDEQQAENSLRKAEDQVAVEAHNAVLGLFQTKSEVEAAHNATDYGERAVDAEEKKMAVGLSTPYLVILAERSLLSSQLTETQARDAYAKSLVEMYRSTGTLLEKSGVKPEDALRGYGSR